MKVRVNIARMAITKQPISARERSALSGQVGRELKRLLDPGVATADATARSPRAPSVAAEIASAIAAQLPRRGWRP